MGTISKNAQAGIHQQTISSNSNCNSKCYHCQEFAKLIPSCHQSLSQTASAALRKKISA
jgi:hypothetical protein